MMADKNLLRDVVFDGCSAQELADNVRALRMAEAARVIENRGITDPSIRAKIIRAHLQDPPEKYRRLSSEHIDRLVAADRKTKERRAEVLRQILGKTPEEWAELVDCSTWAAAMKEIEDRGIHDPVQQARIIAEHCGGVVTPY
ncbi:MAG: hypothetical protein ABIB97_03600 [Patescibacteria group bacterium]